MAQSALTVTPPTPTPPTNFQFTGTTGPNPPNITKVNYANPFNMTAKASGANGSTIYTDDRPNLATGNVGVNPNPPGYYDDGTGATALAFATNKSAIAGGTGATSGGTEGTYPGTDTAPFETVNCQGAVPASSSAAHEGAGLEAAKTDYAFGPNVLVPGDASTYTVSQTPAWAAGDPGGKMRTFGVTPALTIGALPSPNASHASTLSPAALTTLASIAPTTAVSGASGTDTITFTGTNFTPQSVVWVQHGTLPPVRVATTFASATSLTAPVPKRTAAGASTVWVNTGGVIETVTKPITYS